MEVVDGNRGLIRGVLHVGRHGEVSAEGRRKGMGTHKFDLAQESLVEGSMSLELADGVSRTGERLTCLQTDQA